MQAWGLTDVGMVRAENQDAFVIQNLSDSCLLAIVCDGMGGASSGDIASRLALQVFARYVSEEWNADMTGVDLCQLLCQGVEQANAAVFAHAETRAEYRGMGTTLVAALVCETAAYVVNVGDSRAYSIGESGIAPITVDHSLVQILLNRGELTPEEARTHPDRNLITRAVGTEAHVSADAYEVPSESWEALLLCSDGLTNLVADQEILFEIAHGETKADCCHRLLQIAKNRGAPDNVTAVLVTR